MASAFAALALFAPRFLWALTDACGVFSRASAPRSCIGTTFAVRGAGRNEYFDEAVAVIVHELRPRS
jgi:hypothetical protein